MNFLKSNNIYLPAIVLAVSINIFSWHLPFFWDTILTSTITQHIYHTGAVIPLPEYDAGHPPLFYLYHVWFYHLIDMNLFTAHLSMLPFTILGIICFIQLLQHFSFSKTHQLIGVVLYFAIPAVITQNTLVSYDAVLLSLYLAALVAFLKNKKIIFSIILIGIVGITLRGLFCLAALSITIYFLKERNKRIWFKWNLYFIPSLFITGSWYYYHYTQTGWFISTNAAGWSEHRGFVDMKGLFKNGISIARCFFDIGIFILSFISLFYLLRKKKKDNYTLLWLIPSLIFSISFLPFTNPINHRYFLIVYVLMLLTVIQFLSNRKIIYSILTILILMLGHFQIYPVPISNAWDCTLAHISFHKGMNNVNQYLSDKFISKSDVGSVFPIITSEKQRKLDGNNSSERFINVTDTSVSSCEYLVFSNIGNDFNDKCFYVINEEYWEKAYSCKNGLVYFDIYRNPHFGVK